MQKICPITHKYSFEMPQMVNFKAATPPIKDAIYIQNTPVWQTKCNHNIYEAAKQLYAIKTKHKITFTGKDFISGTDLPKIQTEEEYKKVLERMKKHKAFKTNWTRHGTKNYVEALQPYAGEVDCHLAINTLMREKHIPVFVSRIEYGRDVNPLDENLPENLKQEAKSYEDFYKDAIRITDYGLRQLDKKFGVYQGIVYRCGFTFGDREKITQNFVSTATKPKAIADFIYKDYKAPCDIFIVKNGHKVYEMQKEIGSGFADFESEVILDPGIKFKEIKEEDMSPDMKKLKKDAINQILDYLDEKQDYRFYMHFYNNNVKSGCRFPIRIWKQI